MNIICDDIFNINNKFYKNYDDYALFFDSNDSYYEYVHFIRIISK